MIFKLELVTRVLALNYYFLQHHRSNDQLGYKVTTQDRLDYLYDQNQQSQYTHSINTGVKTNDSDPKFFAHAE